MATKTQVKSAVSVQVKVALAMGAIGLAAAGFVMISSAKKPTVSILAASPSGMSVPANSELLLAFNVKAGNVDADYSSSALGKRLLFEINSTDNAGSGWNTCAGDMGQMTKWALKDASGIRVDSTGDWIFLNSSKTPCSVGEQVRYTSTTCMNCHLSPGDTKEYYLYFDTTGASAAANDAIRADIPNAPVGFKWTDSRGDLHRPNGLPVTGGTLLF